MAGVAGGAREARPRGGLLREALRLLPDLLRLLAADRSLPRSVRIRLALLLAYLAVPIDIVPDFIPILGYADDAIIVTIGRDAFNWPHHGHNWPHLHRGGSWAHLPLRPSSRRLRPA
jgi:hypothetical protein